MVFSSRTEAPTLAQGAQPLSMAVVCSLRPAQGGAPGDLPILRPAPVAQRLQASGGARASARSQGRRFGGHGHRVQAKRGRRRALLGASSRRRGVGSRKGRPLARGVHVPPRDCQAAAAEAVQPEAATPQPAAVRALQQLRGAAPARDAGAGGLGAAAGGRRGPRGQLSGAAGCALLPPLPGGEDRQPERPDRQESRGEGAPRKD
mmetsp:Transcript_24367/g.58081  ORF Transcript_24367/g.58081 Transcript_24367/m.58081 type:complete len:205 (+) Transcript_24367:903-1517(+)